MNIHQIIEKKRHEVGSAAMVFFLWMRDRYPEGVTLAEVIDTTPVTKRQVYRYLNQLRESEMVQSKKRKRRTIYIPAS